MLTSQVNKIIAARNTESKSTLVIKGEIYSAKNDRLHNFKSVAAMNGVTQQEALWGMVSKHIIAVKDVVYSDMIPTKTWIMEYLGDIHNYLYLLEAIWQEQRDNRREAEKSDAISSKMSEVK